MDGFDEKMKCLLGEETDNIRLSTKRKQAMRQAMMAEITAGKQSLLRRLMAKISVYWESAHELSLAPLAAASILLVVAGLGLLYAGPEPVRDEPAPQVFFVSQSNGAMEIIRLADQQEE